MTQSTALTSWQVRAGKGPVPEALRGIEVAATVPGSVHTDLMAAGLIADPYLDTNELLQGWIGRTDWHYRTTLDLTDTTAERADLVLLGLDTVARVSVDGEPLLETSNMHRTHRVDVSRWRGSSAELTIDFSAPVPAANRASLELGPRPHTNHHPYNALRKMACSFGWDWGPDTTTSGPWRPVLVETWHTARLAAVRPTPRVDEDDRGVVDVVVEMERAEGSTEPLTVELVCGDVSHRVEVPPGDTGVRTSLDAGTVRRWWPRGHGEPHLYDLQVRLLSDEVELDATTQRIGFRTITVDTTPDEAGTPFTVVVNGRPVFVRGVNWIPDDAFPHRVDRARYAARLTQAEEAGVNLVRVWGGGIYEDDAFYDECDERGLMVWQDFLFACAAYAEEEPLRGEVVAEVRDNVTRLMPHPSLVLWNGNNENLWGHEDWQWKERLDGRTWGEGYYSELLPRLVEQLDPGRPYTPGSPFTPDSAGEHHPNDPRHGSVHVWDVWNARDWTAYLEYRPRFVAEFGWQAPPTWATLRRSIADDPMTPESPGMLVHQKAGEGHTKLVRGLVPHLREPVAMEAWHWAMQLNQARALRTGIEHFRSLWPHCAGTVWWQLNDCWPVTSWAVVDGDGRRKPSFYALRHAYADRILVLGHEDEQLVVTAVNDTDEDWAGSLRLVRLEVGGDVLAEEGREVAVPARSASRWPVGGPGLLQDPARELVLAELDGVRGWHFGTEDRDGVRPEATLETEVLEVDGGYEVRVTARTLVRDLVLLADAVAPDAVVDDMLLTLLPGETHTFTVRTGERLSPDALVAPVVLRSVNQLV
ncbi:glycoside hydrolase family 2 protein [Auraticoccus monumenti]|uniref:beta-mannosidase n=1 Tax=Auraticoccus monumenti TaxID=675864 RepID=A0A1G6T0X8_9ACTN|nr:glycoside hydrolase family 2 protein [Auraticoccus monumenti]SDD22762.1 beta-mannosidase [Auraticoccus monumenti]